jgi:hypothetical protein
MNEMAARLPDLVIVFIGIGGSSFIAAPVW